MLAAIARVPGMAGQEASACGAYTQNDLTCYEA